MGVGVVREVGMREGVIVIGGVLEVVVGVDCVVGVIVIGWMGIIVLFEVGELVNNIDGLMVCVLFFVGLVVIFGSFVLNFF